MSRLFGSLRNKSFGLEVLSTRLRIWNVTSLNISMLSPYLHIHAYYTYLLYLYILTVYIYIYTLYFSGSSLSYSLSHFRTCSAESHDIHRPIPSLFHVHHGHQGSVSPLRENGQKQMGSIGSIFSFACTLEATLGDFQGLVSVVQKKTIEM